MVKLHNYIRCGIFQKAMQALTYSQMSCFFMFKNGYECAFPSYGLQFNVLQP